MSKINSYYKFMFRLMIVYFYLESIIKFSFNQK